MADLHLTRRSSAPPRVLWDVLTDFAAYGQWMPLTTMRLDDGAPRPGWGFAARSAVGPVGFTDPMLVTVWEAPTDGRARFRVVKTGRVLGGWVEARVEPDGPGSRLLWDEEVVVRPVPLKRVLAPVVRAAAGGLYGRALDAIVARAEEVAG